MQGERHTPLARKPELSEAEMAVYGRKVSDFADWCARQGMPLSYHHHMAAAVETEPELDRFMKHSSVPLLFDAGHMAFAGGDNLRVIDNHHARITHVHTKDVRQEVIDGIDRSRDSFLDAVIKGAFTVPGDGSLDFEAIEVEGRCRHADGTQGLAAAIARTFAKGVRGRGGSGCGSTWQDLVWADFRRDPGLEGSYEHPEWPHVGRLIRASRHPSRSYVTRRRSAAHSRNALKVELAETPGAAPG